MKKKGLKKYVKANLMWGGILITLTGVFIALGKPNNIFILTKTFTGNPTILFEVLTAIGSLTALLGYTLKE